MKLRDILIGVLALLLVVVIWMFVLQKHGDELFESEPVVFRVRRMPAGSCEYNIDRTNEICWLHCGVGLQLISKYEGCTTLLAAVEKE